MTEALLFSEDWTPELEAALRHAMREDAAFADAVALWRRMQATVRRNLVRSLPDHHVLIAYALATSPYAEVLSAAERSALEAARPALEAALAAHPALRDVVRDVQEAAAAFEAVWEAQWPGAGEPPAPAPDRPARRRAAARTPATRWTARIGLGVALALFVGLVGLLWLRDGRQITIEVPPDAVQTVALADGSTVRLLGGATLTYADPDRPTAFDRHVRLTGAAFFDVVKEARGFTVETPHALATVLGTSFGVVAGEEQTEVTLVTGAVALAPRAAPDRPVRLAPGQRSVVAAGALASTPEAVDLTEALRWTRQFVFQDTPLEVAVARLSEHYGVPVYLDEALAREPVTGRFAEEDYTLKEILDILARSLNAEVRLQPDGSYRLLPGA